ncbi:MAG: hypothetical protein JXR13_04545 [Thalassovita sp.]
MVTVLVLGLAWVVYSSIGRTLQAPPWLHTQLQSRLTQMVPDADVRFGAITLVVESNGRPRISLRDVEFAQPGGPVVLAVSDLEAGFAPGPLLQGKMRLGRVRVSGAEILVRQRKDGSFDLAFGASLPEVEQAASLSEIIGELDDLLLSDELIELDQIEADALIVRYEDLRAGRAWTIDGGRLRLERGEETLQISGDLALLGGYDYVTTVALSFESEIGSNAAQFGMNFEDMAAQDIAVQSAAVAWLDVLRAPISGALRGSVDEIGAFGPISGTLQIAAGVVQPTPETKPVPFKSARSYFTFEPDTQTLQFDELSVVSKWITGRAEGKAVLQGAPGSTPEAFLGQFTVQDLTAAPEGVMDIDVTLDRAQMSFRMGLDPFTLTVGELVLEERGQLINVSGEAVADPEGWRLSAKAQSAALDPEVVLDLWPEDLKAKTRLWVSENVHAISLRNAQLAYRNSPGQEPDLYAGFEFEDANLTFARNMPPIQDGAGHAALHGQRFVATADRGKVHAPQGGQVDITGTTFIVPDVRIKPAPAEVRLRAEGAITAALSLLDQKPLNLMGKAGRPVDLADGRVRAQGVLNMPLQKKLPPERVLFDVTASLRDVYSNKLVPGRELRAPQLALNATNEMLQIRGNGSIGQARFHALFEDDLSKEDRGKSKVYADVALNQAFLDEFNIALPRGSVAGEGKGAFELALVQGQAPKFNLTSDLAGLSLRLGALGWSKSANRTGALTISGALSTPPQIDSLALSSAGLNARGSVTLKEDGQLESLRFSRVQAGNWLDAPITLHGQGKGRAPKVDINGGTVDLRNLPKLGGATTGSGAGSKQGLKVNLDRLRVTEKISLDAFKGTFSTSGELSGQFSGLVNGAAAVTGQVSPVGGRSSFEVRAKDAGAVLSAAGLLNRAKQGELLLSMIPVGNAGHYDGYLTISNLRIIEIPALAALLHAVSIVGLLEQLGGPGILFSEIEAKFRLSPEQLVVRSSSAVGASMGLSLDGGYELATNQMDFQGVLSPLYALNGIGSLLTRKGEGLLGFNFRLTGASSDPKVQVNPLSIFTPGMFREIFRRPVPKVRQ